MSGAGRLLRAAGVADLPLAATALTLAVLGLVVVRDVAVEPRAALAGETLRHGAYLAAGLAVMLIAGRLDYRLLQRLAPLLYAGALLTLVLVLLVGSAEFGARRWLALGPITVQPSELGKLALAITLAAFAARRSPGARMLLVALVILAPPLALVLVEPDLGTSLVLIGGWVTLVLVAGVPWRTLGVVALVGLALAPLAFAVGVSDYQRERIAVFVNPDRDPMGSGFALRRVELAFAGSGLTGHGVLEPDDGSVLDAVAARNADFVFAQVGDSLGLLGTAGVLALFGVVAWRGTRAAARAPDRFGLLLAATLTGIIVVQAALHVAVNVRLFPATGIPLPFVSQGGSALVAMLATIGVLQSIAAGGASPDAEEWSPLRARRQ